MTTGSYVQLFDNFYYGIHPAIVDPILDIDIYFYLTEPHQAEVYTNCQYYYEYPIIDRQAISVRKLRALVKSIMKELKQGHSVYIACKGGHGRSGLVAGAVLAFVKGWDYPLTKQYLQQEWEQQRKLETPQTKIQKAQLLKYCEYLSQKKRRINDIS